MTAFCVPAAGKHQFEAVGVVGGFGLEGVARWSLSLSKGQQVHIGAGEVINKVQIAETDLFGVEMQRVGAVPLGLEIDGDFPRWSGVDHSVVFAVLRDVEHGAALAEALLAKHVAFTEADDDIIHHSGPLGDRHVERAATGGRRSGEIDIST